MPDKDRFSPGVLFQIFNEIGIIEQLSRAILEAKLPKGLLGPHFAILNHLIRVADGRTPVELARAFQVPKTTMTHSVGILEKHGLVAVRPNPNDGRSKCVWLTDAGRGMRDDTIAALAPEFEVLMEGLDMARLVDALPALTDLRVFLDTHRHAEAPRDRAVR